MAGTPTDLGRTQGPPERALRALLSRLDADEEQGAEAYERLRRKLVTFFAGRSSPEPEELADETLDRLGRRIHQGEPIQNPGSYAYGIARLLLAESSRRRRRRAWLLSRASPSAPPWNPDERSDPRLECIRRCAARLASDDRHLLFEYYGDEGPEQRQARRTLSERLGIAAGALRLRVFRIRRCLEACARRCALASGTRLGAR